MKLLKNANEAIGFTLGSKQHADAIAATMGNKGKMTVGVLRARLKSERCTMPQVHVDEILDTLRHANKKSTDVLSDHDLEQICAIAGADLGEVKDLLGEDLGKRTVIQIEKGLTREEAMKKAPWKKAYGDVRGFHYDAKTGQATWI